MEIEEDTEPSRFDLSLVRPLKRTPKFGNRARPRRRARARCFAHVLGHEGFSYLI